MKMTLKKSFAVAGLALITLASQPVLADGWRHHGRGHYSGSGWVPFALGAVVGGVAMSAMLQPQPVYIQPNPIYGPPPVYVRPRVIVPPAGYVVPLPPAVYYSY